MDHNLDDTTEGVAPLRARSISSCIARLAMGSKQRTGSASNAGTSSIPGEPSTSISRCPTKRRD